MSGSRPSVDIRISAQGGDETRRKFEAVGVAGENAMRRVAQASAAATPGMQSLATASDVAQRGFVSMGGSLGRVGAVATSVSGVAGGLATGLLALGAAGLTAGIGIAKAGDATTAMLSRLQAATGSVAAARDVYESLYQVSQKTGIAVAESAGAFVRFQVAAGEIGATRAQVLKLVEGLQKVAIVSGASGQESASAMQQLGQALASGKLAGDELRSIMENMPQLAQGLARELGVNIGQLRKMGEEGTLTADRVFPALLRATEKMGADFDKMPVTMSRSFDILGAAMLDFTSKLNESLGLSQAIARAVKVAADAVNGVRAAAFPTDREQAQSSVAAAASRVAQLRSQIALGANVQAAGVGQLASPQDRTFGTAALSEQLRAAESELRGHQAKLSEIEKEGQADRFGQYVSAQAKAAEAARTSAATAFDAAETKAQELIKLDQEYLKSQQVVDAAERTGAASAERIAAQRLALADDYYKAKKKLIDAETADERRAAETSAKAAQAAIDKRQGVITSLDEQVRAAREALAVTQAGAEGSHEMAVALATEAKLREAGIPVIEKRTEAEKKAAEAIAGSVRALDDLKEANKSAEAAAKKLADFHAKSSVELANIGERAFDRLGDALVDAFVSGQGAAVNFGNVTRAILSSVIADVAKLGVINPILNSIFTSSQGPRATLAGAFGGSATSLGGGFGIPGIGSLFGDGGLSGLMAGANSYLFGSTAGPLAEVTTGLLGSGGSMSLGALGAGFGSGMFVNSMLGGNQLGGGIGSGIGSLAGMALGSMVGMPWLGAILGGAAGGGLGGLIGPGESVKGYGLRFQSSGFTENGANDFGTSLLPTDRKYYNESGAAVFQQADQIIAAVNAFMAANDLEVRGASILEGTKNGLNGSIGAAFSGLQFGAASDSRLNSYLSGQSFDDPAKLQVAVDGFKQAAAVIDALGAESLPAFSAQLKAVNDNFDAGVEAARKYGLAEDNLTTARAKALAGLEAARAETLRQTDASLAVRRLTAAGDSQAAALAQQAEAAIQELASFTAALDALALTAQDKGARLVALEEVQAAERAAIITRYGEQAAASLQSGLGAGQNLLRELAFGGSSALAPEQKYFAALSTLNQAKQDLDAGGSLASYSAIASQVLPVARDYLGTSQRYAGLAAEVGQVLSSRGADGAGLSSILSAQVDGMNGMQNTFAAYGDLNLSALNGLRTDFQRLAATVEALITRRSAA